jgi:hypothetical protein
MLRQEQGRAMDYTFEFFRIRPGDRAHATLDRVAQTAPNFDLAKVRALSLFESLDMPQRPDGLRILDSTGSEIFIWTRPDP